MVRIVGRITASIAISISGTPGSLDITAAHISTTVVHTNLLLQPEFFTEGLLLDTVCPPSNLIKSEIEIVRQIGTGFAPRLVFKVFEVVVVDLDAIEVTRGEWVEMTHWDICSGTGGIGRITS